jgi:hypothetical protein
MPKYSKDMHRLFRMGFCHSGAQIPIHWRTTTEARLFWRKSYFHFMLRYCLVFGSSSFSKASRDLNSKAAVDDYFEGKAGVFENFCSM